MPCFSYSLPAAECNVGSRLRSVVGSVCHGCYAHKGNYTRFPEVQKALYRRLKAIKKKFWVAAMSYLIKGEDYFRFHDSGDIMSEKHFEDIMTICENCPDTKFWIPTREYETVEKVLKRRTIPPNLALRLSAHMMDESGPILLAKKLGVQISEVASKGYTCPASTTNNQCASCRKCWDTSIFNISYKKH